MEGSVMIKMSTVEEVNEFRNIVSTAKGHVWAEDRDGFQYDLKSELGQLAVVYEILRNPDNDLELYASDVNDELALIGYLIRLKGTAA